MSTSTVPVVLGDEMAARIREAADEARRWTVQRDELVRQAARDGASLREIAGAVGLTHTGVRRILKREQQA